MGILMKKQQFPVGRRDAIYRVSTNALRQIPTHYGKYQRITANTNALRQIPTHYGKYQRITANTNALRQIGLLSRMMENHEPSGVMLEPTSSINSSTSN
jgi:ribosomal protein L28